MDSRTQKMLIVLTFGLMLVQGCIDNIRGVLIPSIKETFMVSYTSIATMILVSTFGYIVATFTGGMMTDRVGQKKVILIGFAFILAAIFGISTAGLYYLFVFAMFILGYGIGLLTIGASTLAPIIFVKNQGVMMNLMHFFYGMGATIGPRFAGGLLDAGVTWQNVYWYGLIPVGLVFLYFLLCKFPKIEESEKEEKISLLEILKNKRVILFSLILGFYVASEVGLANWFATYLQHAKGMTELSSASYLSIFFMIFTVGRLVGGFIAEKLGYMRSVFLFVSLALTCLIVGVFGGQNLTIVISIGGFFFSIVYPTMMVVLIKSFRKGLNSILGVVMTASSGINMMANWIIGRVNDVFNEAVGFSMIIFFLTMVLCLMILLNRELSHQNE